MISSVYLSISLSDNNKIKGKKTKRRPILGVGINDSDYVTQVRLDGRNVMCPAYVSWCNMLRRCYSSEFHKKFPTYSNVTVCDDWLSFMKFREWWIGNYVDGWQLDKDLLSKGNTTYSEDKCIYVPHWLNSFTLNNLKNRGDYPVGVDYLRREKSFRSRCCEPLSGTVYDLGLFDNPDEAHNAWRSKKLEIALNLRCEMDKIDSRIYPNVVEIIAETR